MNKSLKILLAATTASALIFGHGALATGSENALNKAQAAFERGLRGSESDNDDAATQFQRLSQAEPGNPLYLAYFGSSLAIKARDAWLPWKKLKFGEQGLEQIDKALKRLTPEHDKVTPGKVPVSIETRLVAVETYLKVPDQFFHRYDSGKALLAETLKNPAFAQSPPQVQARFHWQAAVVAKRDAQPVEERTQLTRALELDPQSSRAAAARARLKELGA